MTPRILLATLCLNEMEWLPALVKQHRNWPGLCAHVFVEAADSVYRQANPGRVSPACLSVDGTTEFLRDLAKADHCMVYTPHGLSTHTDPSQGKIQARNRYLEVAEEVRPDFVVVLDADEFYTQNGQVRLAQLLAEADRTTTGISLPFRNVWRPPCLASQDLFAWEAIGGYWSMAHCHVWRWRSGLRYGRNHITPDGSAPHHYHARPSVPQCVHMGFAAAADSREAKHAYYVARGEGRENGLLGQQRQKTVDCRAAWKTWAHGQRLPHGGRVIPYRGPIPEVFIP